MRTDPDSDVTGVTTDPTLFRSSNIRGNTFMFIRSDPATQQFFSENILKRQVQNRVDLCEHWWRWSSTNPLSSSPYHLQRQRKRQSETRHISYGIGLGACHHVKSCPGHIRKTSGKKVIYLEWPFVFVSFYTASRHGMYRNVSEASLCGWKTRAT